MRQSVPKSPSVSRRGVLVAAGGGTIAAPALAASAPSPSSAEPDDAPKTEFVYEAIVTLGPVEEVGQTPYGRRVRIPITGGTFKGPRISGVIFPEGMDWQLIRPDGFTVLEASYLMRADDGAVIHIRNVGVAGKGYVRTTPVFEAPNGPHAWLNEAVFVGTVGPVPELDKPAVRIRVFKLV